MNSANPRAGNLGYWCSASAAQFPDKVALIDLSRDPPRETTYAELERRLDRVAATLTRLGLESGDRLAMSISNRVEFVEIMFGAMRAGIVPVPLNAKLGPGTLRYVIEDSGCRGAVIEPAANAHVAGIVASLGLEARPCWTRPAVNWFRVRGRALAASGADLARPPLAAFHLAFLAYTSASTGKPKGVALDSRRTMLVDRLPAQILADADGEPRSRRRAFVSQECDGRRNQAVAERRRLHRAAAKLRAAAVSAGARRLIGCTHAGGVPAVFTLLLQQKDLIESLDFSALKGLKIGSAPTPKELLDAVEAAFGVPASESYGLTEGGPVMIGPPLDGRPTPHGSCGVAWPEGRAQALVGADGQERRATANCGCATPGVTPGYYRLPEVRSRAHP